ncbi:MAG: hypothetical protein LC749_20475, partial [Actinobacteria bacterium]|nr:hypothetical protein [Actinomycetota bacterium]
TLRFPVVEQGRPVGRLYVQASQTERRLPGKPPDPGFLMNLTFRAPLPTTTDRSNVEEAMYRGRNAIVRVFTAVTKANWHETWERTK